MLRIISVLATGLLGFAFPRVLVGMGVPLEMWALSVGQWLGLISTVNTDTAFWIISASLGFVFAGVEAWKRPVGQLWGRLVSWRSAIGPSQPKPQSITPNYAVARRQIA